MSRCTECDARIDPGMECIWWDTPTCSTCCGCDDDEPTTPRTAALDRLRAAVLTDLALETA